MTELNDEQLAEVMAASFPRERKVRLRRTVSLMDADGDLYVTLDPTEQIIGVAGHIVWVAETA